MSDASSLLNTGKGLPNSGDVFQRNISRSEFAVHDQKDRSTCCAHATTACPEILRGKQLEWSDLFSDEWEDESSLHPGNPCVGALIAECSRTCENTGQRTIGGRRRKVPAVLRAKFKSVALGNIDALKAQIVSGHMASPHREKIGSRSFWAVLLGWGSVRVG